MSAPTDADRAGPGAASFERHRRELVAHCYRMTGSFTDAEELTQETFLRAWRSRDRFDGRSSQRTWLYRIATNACLDFLKNHERRTRAHPSVDEILEHEGWIGPHPDRGDPADTVVRRAATDLRVTAALLALSPRQRAAVVARDLAGLSAAETATVLECSVASVNSLLQRGRAHARRLGASADRRPESADDAEERTTVRAYLDAYHRGDVDAILDLLTADVRLTMPPEAPSVGRREARVFLDHMFGADGPGRWHLVEVRANGATAIANYTCRPDADEFTALSVDVLQVEGGRIRAMHSFLGAAHVELFGLPPTVRP